MRELMLMKCKFHPEKPGGAACSKCGGPLCGECAVHTQGSVFCRTCLGMGSGAGPSPSWGGHAVAVNKKLLLALCVFLPPGVGYMYMGLIKRGLVAMIGFYFLAFLVVASPGLPLSLLAMLSMPVLYFACIFDSFAICRRAEAGEAVPDGAGRAIASLLSNKKLCMALIAALALAFGLLALGFAVRILIGFLPLVVIFLGLYVIFFWKK